MTKDHPHKLRNCLGPCKRAVRAANLSHNESPHTVRLNLSGHCSKCAILMDHEEAERRNVPVAQVRRERENRHRAENSRRRRAERQAIKSDEGLPRGNTAGDTAAVNEKIVQKATAERRGYTGPVRRVGLGRVSPVRS